MERSRVDTPVEDQMDAASTGARAEDTGRGDRYAWLRRPDFWLAVALAAFLRLWHIETTQFLDDQTFLMQLARGAFLHGALPITGIPSSIGTLNPPLSIYLLMPFTLFSANPLPIAIFIALWNVLGVALCYIFTERYFGRWAAATAALLFATCGAVINYSRFIWQQNYLPPILVLWIWTLYRGSVSGRRRWFVANVLLLVAAAQLHPTTLLLAPVTVVGLLLAPRSALPRIRAYVIAAAIIVVLFVPTALWQLLNNGSDLRTLLHYATRHSNTNLDVFVNLFAALGTPSPADFGPGSPLASLARWYPLLSAGTTALFVLGMIVLTVRVFAPVRAAWRSVPVSAQGRVAQVRAGALGLWRGLRADAGWRANLLLWLMVVVPVALMVRHSNALTVHYLMVLYPSAFIAAGFGVQAIIVWARGHSLSGSTDFRSTLARATPVLAVIVLALVVAVQSALWTSYPTALASGQFDAYNGYGYPLGEVQQADAALASLQQRYHAVSTSISIPTDQRYREPLDYLLVSEHPGRVDSTDNCLLLPAPASGPSALLVSVQPSSLAGTLAAKLPNLKHVADVQVPGGTPWAVYSVTGAPGALADEQIITPITFADAAGNGLRLDAFSMGTNGMIRLRWTILGSADRASGTPWYRIQPGLPAATTGGTATALTRTECQPSQWQAGQTLYTWVSLPGQQATPQSLSLLVRGGTLMPRIKDAGPFKVLAGRFGGEGLQTLPPATGQKTADGALVLPLGEVGLP